MMPTLRLTHIQFTQLQPMTWCATAQVSESPHLRHQDLWSKSLGRLIADDSYINTDEWYKRSWQYHISPDNLSVRDIARAQRQRQRRGVRLLLEQLLDKLALSDTLDESAFPYRLVKGGHYVCFSHTGGKSKTIHAPMSSTVAVVISPHHPIGVDVELNNVAWHVAKRFYSDNEIVILQSLPVIQRDTIAKLLWQIKESFIKIHQYKLAQGLGTDYSHLIDDLIDASREPSALTVITDHKLPYQIAVLSIQQTVVVF
ncbi:4'-phosphopantetheinyl transferase family protein [Psychrobacter fjordensis]|uniref:4'-phosphopantetheinyl transferase family protein n=1 Tax=Psychrobacter fjordensis TaxID=664424 RepID=UPI00191A064E|nr:4'-phosphopantetheinyl transferase superfamily protein [Psychrobacter fjordensis]